MEDYLPLKFIKKKEDEGIKTWEFIKFVLKTSNYFDDSYTEEEFREFMRSRNFLDKHYKGKFSKLNDAMMGDINFLKNVTGIRPCDIRRGASIEAEWSDVFYSPFVFEDWERNKQVYKFDSEMANALLTTVSIHKSKAVGNKLYTDDEINKVLNEITSDTSKDIAIDIFKKVLGTKVIEENFNKMVEEVEYIELSKEDIEHLPVQTFYVDLSDCENFQPFHGVFVDVKIIDDFFSINLQMLRNDMMFFSWILRGEVSNDGTIKVKNPYELKNAKAYEVADFETHRKKSRVEMPRVEVASLCLQLLIYLTSREPDISESPVTKNTYRPLKPCSKIRNKFSEVRIQDVGVRFGNAIRLFDKEQKEKNAREGGYIISDRKSPRPHYRNAHWRRVHYGKKHSQVRTQWIPPSFVGFNPNNNEVKTDVVIHKIK